MLAPGQQPAVFELCDTTLAEIAPEVLGLWTAVPTASPPMLAFESTTAPTTTVPVWRANLPGDLHLATTYLGSGESQVQTAQRALTAIPDRLQAFMNAQAAGLALDAAAVQTFAQPEVDLLATLHDLQAGQPPASFALGERLMGGWEHVAQQFQAVLERLQRSLIYYAWVETRLQEQLLGQTAVSWTGSVDTVWHTALAPQEAQLHQRTLALALQSRSMLLHTFAMATQCVVRLSVLLSIPGGVLLALPAAWTFIQQVLAESCQGQIETQEGKYG